MPRKIRGQSLSTFHVCVSKTAERALKELDRKQETRIIYKFCVVRQDGIRGAPGRVIYMYFYSLKCYKNEYSFSAIWSLCS